MGGGVQRIRELCLFLPLCFYLSSSLPPGMSSLQLCTLTPCPLVTAWLRWHLLHEVFPDFPGRSCFCLLQILIAFYLDYSRDIKTPFFFFCILSVFVQEDLVADCWDDIDSVLFTSKFSIALGTGLNAVCRMTS